MHIFKYKADLQDFLNAKREHGATVGFVPTMGALHKGHTALVERSNQENSVSVVTIFVNPTQFNDSGDFAKYPKTIDRDIDALIAAGCDVLFLPEVSEMYTEVVSDNFDFGHIGNVYEGEYRPGHFDGMATIVKKFFEIIVPNNAYFGKKDYQQWLIVTKIAEQLGTGINVVGYETVREADGLAMSSRNLRLNKEEREVASLFPETLFSLKTTIHAQGIKEALDNAQKKLTSNNLIELEYLDIVDCNTLKKVDKYEQGAKIMAIAAIKVGEIRLIDNLQLTE